MTYLLKSRLLFAALILTFLPHCSFGDPDTAYPMEDEDTRRVQRGSLFNQSDGGGFTLFGGSSDDGDATGSGPLSVNAFLWRAALDTISFMPLASTDPFGGVVVTDWYQPPQKSGERFKLHVVILSKQLRSDAVKVRLFRQEKSENGEWEHAEASPEMHRKFEDIILARARELRLAAEK